MCFSAARVWLELSVRRPPTPRRGVRCPGLGSTLRLRANGAGGTLRRTAAPALLVLGVCRRFPLCGGDFFFLACTHPRQKASPCIPLPPPLLCFARDPGRFVGRGREIYSKRPNGVVWVCVSGVSNRFSVPHLFHVYTCPSQLPDEQTIKGRWRAGVRLNFVEMDPKHRGGGVMPCTRQSFVCTGQEDDRCASATNQSGGRHLDEISILAWTP